MPLTKYALARYRIIDNCLRNKRRPYPTLDQLADACSEALNRTISNSTIEKDLAAMKNGAPDGALAPIAYSKIRKGYFYAEEGFTIKDIQLEEEEWESLSYASKLLYQYKEVPVFLNFREAIEKIHARFNITDDFKDPNFEASVQFEKGNSSKGFEWLADIYQALKERFAINITYDNIYKGEIKPYRISPFLLKEHRNRWYVIGWEAERNAYLTFALDRIQSLSIVSQKQKRRFDFDPRLFLKNTIGIMEIDGGAALIELEIMNPIDKLVLLDPIHPSQQVKKQTSKSTILQLEVNINPELHYKLLSFGKYCKVRKPASLKASILEHVKEMLKNHQP
jgi:predicted DNA-binding transcriptional regulator YafY